MWAVRYWNDLGEEHYEVYHQKKRIMDLIKKLESFGWRYEYLA